MSIIPVVAAGAIVAVTPPLRRRVVPVGVAVTAAALATGTAAINAITSVTVTATEGVVGVGRAALHGPKAESGS